MTRDYNNLPVTFLLGFVTAMALFIAIMSNFPRGSVPYDKGMLDCKLEPTLCQRKFEVFLAEQRLEQLRNQK